MSLAGGRIDANEFTPTIAEFFRISEMRAARGAPMRRHSGIQHRLVLVNDEEALGMGIQRVFSRRRFSLSGGADKPQPYSNEQSKQLSCLPLPVGLPRQQLQVRHALSPSGLNLRN